MCDNLRPCSEDQQFMSCCTEVVSVWRYCWSYSCFFVSGYLGRRWCGTSIAFFGVLYSSEGSVVLYNLWMWIGWKRYQYKEQVKKMIRDGTRPKFMEYFKKPVDPKEMVRKWQADVRTQQRHLEKEIRWDASHHYSRYAGDQCRLISSLNL